MKVSWQWVALGAVYLGLAWSATTIISTAFLLGFKPSPLGLIPLLNVLLILVLCLIGIYDIRNRFSRVLGPGPVRFGGARLIEPVLWLAYAITFVGLAWSAADTVIGMFLLSVVFSSLFFGLVVSLFILLALALLALAWCLGGVSDVSARKTFRWWH